MKYLHTMVRVVDLEASLDFYCKHLGLVELKRYENKQARFSLIFLAVFTASCIGVPGNVAGAFIIISTFWPPLNSVKDIPLIPLSYINANR